VLGLGSKQEISARHIGMGPPYIVSSDTKSAPSGASYQIIIATSPL